ncbi:MAG: zf-HC2 domain-containing protein [Candidatus Eisenbacteria sp.]|nr:zf-HC2 domain-containing protein [Candidatus Eisenbacteria bacterium]
MTKCISDEAMAAYVDGRIDPEERRRIESHLVRCDRCIEQIAVLKRVTDSRESLAGVRIPDRVLARAEALIAERFGRRVSVLDLVVRVAEGLVSVVKTTGEVLSPDLCPVPARGRKKRGKNVFVKQRAGTADVIVEMESRGDHPTLRVFLENTETQEPLDGVRVNLKGPAGMESRFAEQGLADFGPKTAGQYRIEIEDVGEVSLEIQS